MPAPKTIVPPGYQIDLDRQPPRPASGCSGAMVLAVGVLCAVIAGALLVVRSSIPASAPPVPVLPTETETAVITTPTLDDWSGTGTALYYATNTATVDYCWWLTPAATPSATLEFTPDAWASTGTAIYEATNPAQPPTATPDAPMAWCNHIPTHTPTITALSLNGVSMVSTDATTSTPSALPMPTVAPAMPPPLVPGVPPTIIYIPPPATEFVPVPTVYVAPTNTARPPRPTRTPTDTPTNTATATETATATATNTNTATATNTNTATIDPERTSHVEPTATLTTTATP